MRKKIIYAVFTLMIAALLAISGMTAGARMEFWRSQEEEAFLQSQSTAVALLSMDIGSEYKGEHVVFAEDIISSLPEGYTLVSREIGEKGLSEGTFGALIVFPADFSLCLTTVNSQKPISAQFSYKLNMNLPEPAMLEVMTDILELEREVNDRISYMYIASVFDEFHDAQDRVSIVLANDEADLEALSQIQSMDLVAMLQLTTLPQELPEFRAADISEYSNDNQSIMSNMGESYQEYLQLAVDDAKQMASETDEIVNDESTGLAAYIKVIDALTWVPEISGKSDSFTNIQEAASASISALSGSLVVPQNDTSALADAIAQSELETDDYKQAREDTIRAMLIEQQDAILSAVKPQDLPADPDSIPSFPSDPGAYDPDTDAALQNALSAMDGSSATAVKYALEQLKGWYVAGYSEANEEMLQTYNSAKGTLDPDFFYAEYDKTGMEDALVELESQHNAAGEAFILALDENTAAFNKQVSDEYDGIQTSLSALDTDIGKSADAERSAMEAYGKGQINALTIEFNEKKQLVQEISTKLNAFNPLQHITDNQDVFTDYATRFRENISGIQTEVSEQVSHDNEQLNKLYSNHTEYIETLKEDIRLTKTEGDELLADAMQVFYAAKTATSASNVENMGEFAVKLPHSRIGMLGNNNMFDFMATPIRSMNSDPLATASLPGEIQRIEFLHGDTIMYLISGAAIILFVGIILVFAVTAIQDNKARKRHEEQMLALEFEVEGNA